MLHADLPPLEEGDIARLYAAHTENSLVIGTGRHGCSTNALLLPSDRLRRFVWGKQSCISHQQVTRTAGFTAISIKGERIALDIDTTDDLLLLAERHGGWPIGHKATERYLSTFALADKLFTPPTRAAIDRCMTNQTYPLER